jgi:hypothetical protein
MPTRAETLVAQFEAATNEAVETIQGCPDTTWKATTPNDGRTVGVVAHHIATGDVPISGLVQAIANAQPMPPLTPEMLNQGNALHAQQFANVTQAETVQLLQQNSAIAASAVRGLTDEQLDRTAEFFGSQWTAQQAIERILIGHIHDHLASIRAAG